MNEEMKKILEQISAGAGPLLQEFCERFVKEDIVDLYAEYYNRAADLDCQPKTNNKESKEISAILRHCEQLIAQKALTERGYHIQMLTKYVKKK